MIFEHHHWYLGSWLPIIALAALIIVAFEVWMIIEAALNKTISDRAKAWWIAGMLLVHPFVAIAYFFTDYHKR